MNQARNIGREIGTALAVLALYLLTVLSPIHHAHASQLAFQELGYATAQASWTLCSSAGAMGDQDDASPAKCPGLGVGKAEVVPPVLHALPAAYGRALAAPLFTIAPASLPRTIAPPAGPRAPPVSV